MVRGESVIHDYVGARAGEPGRIDDQGWLHTGDIGEIDAEGRLYYKGRKKEMIVTSEGLNVYPQDVERVLNSLPQVKDSAVVAARRGGEEQVHAALTPPGYRGRSRRDYCRANQKLDPTSECKAGRLAGRDFPRTPSTMKVKRGEVARRIAEAADRGREERSWHFGRIRSSGAQGDLGLSSLERVELLAELESHYGVELDERRFVDASSLDELNALVRNAGEPAPQRDAILLPRWTRSLPARTLRFLVIEGFVIPLFRGLLTLEVEGTENLAGIEPPVLFASNHQSDLDTPAIFAALPRRWRYRVAPAMSQDYFRAWLQPGSAPFLERMKTMVEYFMATEFFNAYPLPQRMSGVRRALKYTGGTDRPRILPAGLSGRQAYAGRQFTAVQKRHRFDGHAAACAGGADSSARLVRDLLHTRQLAPARNV